MFAKPEDGGDALVLVLGDDVVGKGAGLGTEAVFGGDEEALLFVVGVVDDEELAADGGDEV